jgi:hypothetical protein
MRKKILLLALILIPVICLLAGFTFYLPPVHDRLGWRLEDLRTKIKYALHPPEKVVFVPQEKVDEIVRATLAALPPSLTPTQLPLPTLPAPEPTQPGATAVVLPSPTPPPTPTSVPGKVLLKGAVHEYQKFNNCGPATLAVALSYWGWKDDQYVTRAYLRPGSDDRGKVKDDKNVSPSEMVDFVETQTQFKALTRVGGDKDLLKQLIAAGFPVIVEKGFEPPKEEWMGHYELITGFDDPRSRFITQDVYIMPDFPVSYDEVEQRWRDFNSVYIVVYPPEREAEVLSILGPQADVAANYQFAAQKAIQEIASHTGRDQFFAYFDLGSSLVGLKDYAGAAEAYDRAFSIYSNIPEGNRPWRMLWYQFGPYEAYYHTGRYQDVINLASTTLATMSNPVLEEAYYWAGMAREALGETDRAIENLKIAVDLNPNYAAAKDELKKLGVVVQ